MTTRKIMIEQRCTLCNLYKGTSRVKIDSVIGETPVQLSSIEHVDMAFIAEAPGEQEELRGIPLIGPAGGNLNDALRDAGIDRNEVMVGNICRCRPPNNRAPQQKEMQTCYPYLLEELVRIKPKVIVCLGLTATKMILRNKNVKMGESHGRSFSGKPVLGFDCIIVPTWHPSPTTFINNESRFAQMKMDIQTAKTHLGGGSLENKKDWTSIIVSNYKTWEVVFPILKASPAIIIDVETTGLDIHARDARITNVGLTCNDGFGVSVICNEGDWHEKEGEVSKDRFEDFLADLRYLLTEKHAIAHNMNFDAKYIKKQWNIWPKNWFWDTQLAHSVIRPGDSTRLKDISWVYAPQMGGYEHELAAYGGLMHANAYDRAEYNVQDLICTTRVAQKQIEILENEKKLFLMQKIVLPAAEIFSEMEYIGVPIDEYILNELEKDYRKRLIDMKTQMYMQGTIMAFNKQHGRFNPNSNPQVAKILFDKKYCGYDIVTRSAKTGEPSCGKEVLNELLTKYNSEVIKMILDYRAILKLHSTYLKGMKEKIVDGRIHTSYHLDIARSGRISSSNPNLQNIPEISDIKAMFVPDVGYVFVYLDYRQMELVVSVYYTQDPIMREAIESGDAHTYIAKLIFNMPDVSDENRRFVKTLNFGVLYGMGAGKLAKSLGIDEYDARKLIDEYFKLLKHTKIWIDGRRKQAEEKGFVTSKFGRIRQYKPKHLVKFGEKVEYNSAVNHPIQSLASDLMLYAMAKWKRHLVKRDLYPSKTYMALQVHDSITSCVREDLVEEIIKEKKRVFESTRFKFMTLPLSVELKTGHNWGSLSKIEN